MVSVQTQPGLQCQSVPVEEVDMDAWHLFWIIPLAFTGGLLTFAVVFSAAVRHIFRGRF